MGSIFALDAHCLVALAAAWHDRHEATVAAYESRLKEGQLAVVPAQAVVEAYSVLTRLPAPLRIEGEACVRSLMSWLQGVEWVGVAPEAAAGVLEEWARRGVGGGRMQDAMVAEAAARGGADELLSWRVAEMRGVAPAGLVVVEPGE